MKLGMSLQNMAAEIDRQAKAKRDFGASTTAITVVPHDNGNVALKLGDSGEFEINDLAHAQIAEHVKVPKQYYDRMRKEAPELLANNIETWFRKYPADRMVRVLDGKVRAVLSNGYMPLDNIDLAKAMIPVLAKRKLQIMSCDMTERRLYIKAVDEKLFRDVPVGYKMGDGSHQLFETCAPAIIISNSEVGFGRLVIETGVYTKACTNMCLFSSGGMKRTHIGAKHKLLSDVENIDDMLSARTKSATMEALWMQASDVISNAFDEKVIGERLTKIAATTENKIDGRVDKVIELVANRFDLNEDESDSILKHLIEGGSLTQYGLHAAVTRSAQDNNSYDRATELEYLGGKIIELPAAEWRELAAA